MKLPSHLNCKIAVIGLGYVGLPLAIEFAKKTCCKRTGQKVNRKVIGFDINKKRITQLKEGIDLTGEINSEDLISSSINFTSDECQLVNIDFFIVTVPTPIDNSNQPNLIPLIKASETIGTSLKNNNCDYNPIIIYESTVYPGATEEICVPILEKFSCRKFNDIVSNESFYCGYSPERINPGDKKHTLVNIKKITSGSNKVVSNLIDNLYGAIINAGTHKASSIKVAEAAKVIENTQRDLNIALVNELSMIFRLMEIDTKEVIKAAGSKWNFIEYMPGLVGGHCIGVDPYYLTYKAKQLGYYPEIVLAGRRINNAMGKFFSNEIIKMMCKKNISITTSKVLLLGFTFKENCPDIRNTKVIDLYESLKEYNLSIDVMDPLANKEEVKINYNIDIFNSIPVDNSYQIIILAVPHKKFISLKGEILYRNLDKEGLIIDLKSSLPEMEKVIRI